jgi:hypothetical protein
MDDVRESCLDPDFHRDGKVDGWRKGDYGNGNPRDFRQPQGEMIRNIEIKKADKKCSEI